MKIAIATLTALSVLSMVDARARLPTTPGEGRALATKDAEEETAERELGYSSSSSKKKKSSSSSKKKSSKKKSPKSSKKGKGKGGGSPKGMGMMGSPKGMGKGKGGGSPKGMGKGKGGGSPKGKGKGKGGYDPGCPKIPVFFFVEELQEGFVPNSDGGSFDNVAFYSSETGEQLGFYSDTAVDLDTGDCVGTGAFAFDGDLEYMNQIMIQFTCFGASNAITGGTGQFGCADGFETFTFEDDTIIASELSICGSLCPYMPKKPTPKPSPKPTPKPKKNYWWN